MADANVKEKPPVPTGKPAFKVDTPEWKLRLEFYRARSFLYINYPRLYEVMDYCKTIYGDGSNGIATMGVAKRDDALFDFYLNLNFLAGRTQKQIAGVILHEFFHILMLHLDRRAPYKVLTPDEFDKLTLDEKRAYREDAQIWNIATDYAINSLPGMKDMLRDPKSKIHDGLFPDENGLPPGETSEFYYKELKKKHEELKKIAQKLSVIGKAFDDHMWNNMQGTPISADAQAGAGKNDKTVDANASGKLPDEIEKELKEIAVDIGISDPDEEEKAAGGDNAGGQGGKGCGTGHATAGTFKMDARAGVRKTPEWMGAASHAAYHGFEVFIEPTRKKLNRRFGMVFPGRRRVEKSNKLLVAIDVSSSIDLPLLKIFSEHLNGLEKYAEFDVVFFNDEVLNSKGIVYKKDSGIHLEPFRKNMMCRISGGTDFQPLIDLWNIVTNRYDAFLVFTDGDARFHTPPRKGAKKFNWIIYGNNDNHSSVKAINFGKKYFMTKDGKNGKG